MNNFHGAIKEYIHEAVHQYILTGLWSEELDDKYDVTDLSQDTHWEIVMDIVDFLKGNWEAISSLNLSADDMGHNFWLSRNGHGAGFWDRGWGDVGDALHAAAKVYGEYNLFVGCDDKIYGE